MENNSKNLLDKYRLIEKNNKKTRKKNKAKQNKKQQQQRQKNQPNNKQILMTWQHIWLVLLICQESQKTCLIFLRYFETKIKIKKFLFSQ